MPQIQQNTEQLKSFLLTDPPRKKAYKNLKIPPKKSIPKQKESKEGRIRSET
jgi:hypothetical protein